MCGMKIVTIGTVAKGNINIQELKKAAEANKENLSALMVSILLQGAPHPPSLLMGDAWTKPYSREYAAFPASWLRSAKFWPTTGRVDNVYGDRNLVCTLQPEAVEEQAAATA